MQLLGRESRPWLGGVASVLAGVGLLLFMTAVPSAKYAAVEYVNAALTYPDITIW